LNIISLDEIFIVFLTSAKVEVVRSGSFLLFVLSVILSVCRITAKVISRFIWNLMLWCYDWAYQSEEVINCWWWSGPRYGFPINFPLPLFLVYN